MSIKLNKMNKLHKDHLWLYHATYHPHLSQLHVSMHRSFVIFGRLFLVLFKNYMQLKK